MLALLRQEFVNCWVLAKDLDAIAARDGPEVATLCARIRENYKYPVDSVLLAPDLRVLGHVNAHDVSTTTRYVEFLRKGLEAAGRPVPAAAVEAGAEAAKRGPPTPKLVVTPEKPETLLLDVVRCGGFGEPSLVYYTIDATAFADGGVLEIEVRVGRAAIGVTFEVCAAVELPSDEGTERGSQVFMQPVQTKSVASGGTDKLAHTFKKGDPLGFVVKPAGGSEGDVNAFFASVKVRRP